jgi:hypothetical protein
MKDCCAQIDASGNKRWSDVQDLLASVGAAPDLPPQLGLGTDGVWEVPITGPLVNIGSVFTSVVPGPPAEWTESWVLSTDAAFTDPNRTTRLQRADPQPASQALPSGYWAASLVFSYQPGTSTPPTMPPGGAVHTFDVYNGPLAALVLRGRLFRRHSGSNSQDWWLLYPGYVKPTGTTVTELRPKAGATSTLWNEARPLCMASGGMYVWIAYTRAQIP